MRDETQSVAQNGAIQGHNGMEKAPMALSNVCRVAISRRGCVRDVLLHPEMDLTALKQCLVAIFPQNMVPIALKNEKDVLFPLSLLAKNPGELSADRKASSHSNSHLHQCPLELICEGDANVSYNELTRSQRIGVDDVVGQEMDLSQYTLSELMDIFGEAAPTGALDRNTFVKCLQSLYSRKRPVNGRQQDDQAMFSRMFDIFDKDRNGIVDVNEFLSGISVLVSGNRDEKIRTIFKLYDTNNDGFISLDEMTKYLTSVFLVIAETNPQVFHENNVDPIELGIVTAQQCFQEADLNLDGRLSYAEFKQWYTKSNPQSHKKRIQSVQNDQTILNTNWTLENVREIGLSSYSVNDMLQFFTCSATNSLFNITKNEFTKQEFLIAFKTLLQRQRKQWTPEIGHLVEQIFEAFDVDRNNLVDYKELLSGLSILCSGSSDDKIVTAFTLFDENGDGYITMEEMVAYLTSVFRVLYVASSETRNSMQIDPKLLAIYTAQNAFLVADLNRDNKLNFEEFKAWYSQPNANYISNFSPAVNNYAATHQPNAFLSLQQIGQLTNLYCKEPSEMFEILANHVNNDGVLTRESFNLSFQTLIGHEAISRMSPQDQEILDTVLNNLFEVFDSDQNQVVDFCELSSGLALLCKGSQTEKVKATFQLYDVNLDGYISVEEMISYLTSVFRVVYATNASVHQKLGISAEKLAEITAHEAFQQFDTNKDGLLSLEEFTNWYSTTTASLPVSPNSGGNTASNESSSYRFNTLREVRKLLNLKAYAINDIFDFFRNSADVNGNLSKSKFFRCFNKLMSKSTTAGVQRNHRNDQSKTNSVLNKLFELFDSDGNGFVDIQELGAGLSLLCGGSGDEKVHAAFTLYDTNRDGFIQKEEMVQYLSSVFKVLYETSPEIRVQMGVRPHQLAVATAEECFNNFDINQDGKLNLEEFKYWYSNPTQKQLQQMITLPSITIKTINDLTGIDTYSPDDLITVFNDFTDMNGTISKDVFLECFEKLAKSYLIDVSQYNAERLEYVVNSLFQVFDTDGNGVVDANELSSGLLLFANGTRDEKVLAAFNLYDINKDGVICLSEMIQYFTSVFRVIYAMDPSKQQTIGISPEELAVVTAKDVFQEADTDKDEQLTFEEFQRWYSQPKQSTFNYVLAPIDLSEIRRLTNLGMFSVEEVFERFAEYANENGVLSRGQFDLCFESMLKGTMKTQADNQRAKLIMHHLFDLFDQDGNNVIDFSELASGLSILCKGTRDLKVESAFALYDFNGDGYISLDEMTRYLTSVFRVLYQIEPKLYAQLNVSADELAETTAKQAFVDADANKDGKLSFEEFSVWYKNPQNKDMKSIVVNSAPRLMTLEEAKNYTNLSSYGAEEVFELFAEAANEDGLLTKESFNDCFRKIINKKHHEYSEEEKYHTVAFIDKLFEIFDTDKNGFIDFSELTSGLSIFCGGSRDQKVKAAFSLFDFNGDGFISVDEMKRYLTSVFRVLFEMSHERQKLNVTPEELAEVTAEQAFVETDLNHDGRMSLDEFQRWYQKPESESVVHDIVQQSQDIFSIQEARRITNLESYKPSDVFELLAESADTNG